MKPWMIVEDQSASCSGCLESQTRVSTEALVSSIGLQKFSTFSSQLLIFHDHPSSNSFVLESDGGLQQLVR